MIHKNLRVRKEVFDKFENMRYGIRIQKNIVKTQSELIDWLINNSNDKLKEETHDTIQKKDDTKNKHMIPPKLPTAPQTNTNKLYSSKDGTNIPDL